MQLEQLWDEYRTSIKAFLQSRVSNSDDVDDLLQEILIKTYKNIHTIKSDSSAKSWLFQVANRTIIDFYRKQGRSTTLKYDQPWYLEDESEAENALGNCVLPFIKALPEDSKRLLMAVDIDGKSQKEYANELGVKYSTLKSRVKKARGQLRTLFEDCCKFTFDSRGNMIDYDPKSDQCQDC
ncbi:RNA polymerase sigma factor SigZ [Leptothoe spongobia]|uniref:RNA polymerase sigma factor SigZ n=1 Tax=Leptothoe spongobia TAU-MAC 1115 TaxID=1967444 RepID=A0A947DK05_9CYAN|nr:RNA polymerase sigma factor SigZ [Leptothoe spongobia]MBT9317839.1 RNA polymerase sigma factor SigZ [Leptothoe spongobia TAU-MAC 1115]